jgi:hypothetical protein
MWWLKRSEKAYEYHVFISYTTREEELRVLLPHIERFREDIRDFLRHFDLQDVVFMDTYTWGPRRNTDARSLSAELRRAINKSLCMFAFLSSGYCNSPWCQFEFAAMLEDESWFRCPECKPNIFCVRWKDHGYGFYGDNCSIHGIRELLAFDLRGCIEQMAYRSRDARSDPRRWGSDPPRGWVEFIEESALYVRQRVIHARTGNHRSS